MSKLIDVLLKIQWDNHYTNVFMAKKLGISKMHYWRIKTGKSPISAEIEKRAAQVWTKEVLPIFLVSVVSGSNVER